MRRVIFTLLYDRGQFMLSRNFRLQAVGSITWLFDNYDFASVSRGLDELMVLDVSRGPRSAEAVARFAEQVQHIASLCFIPMTIGGGIRSMDTAHLFMRSGADKLLLNSAFQHDPDLCRRLAAHFGRQCIVAGIDYRTPQPGHRVVSVDHGALPVERSLAAWVDHVQACGAGEILFQSVDQDGTGMGLDLAVVDDLPSTPAAPCILMGGVGKADQIIAGLQHPTIDAVATANLFNFIGSAFLEARASITRAGIDVAHWDGADFSALRGRFGA